LGGRGSFDIFGFGFGEGTDGKKTDCYWLLLGVYNFDKVQSPPVSPAKKKT
jgi:hypothetical protein